MKRMLDYVFSSDASSNDEKRARKYEFRPVFSQVVSTDTHIFAAKYFLAMFNRLWMYLQNQARCRLLPPSEFSNSQQFVSQWMVSWSDGCPRRILIFFISSQRTSSKQSMSCPSFTFTHALISFRVVFFFPSGFLQQLFEFISRPAPLSPGSCTAFTKVATPVARLLVVARFSCHFW